MSKKEIVELLQKRSKKEKIIMVLTSLFVISCFMLLIKGNDAVTLGQEKKAAILTSDQVQVSFESVGGRVIEKRIMEEQQVKKGEILMILDSTDIDLSILELEAQIAEMEMQISQTNDSIRLGYEKVNTTENKTMAEIRRQKAAMEAASAAEDNHKRNLDRMRSLYEMGGISKSEFENVLTNYEISVRSTSQQKRSLDSLLEGASQSEIESILRSDSVDRIYLSEIDQSRQDLANEGIGVSRLEKQKERLSVQLEVLKVQKNRLTLRAPVDGKITKVIAKEGEMVAPNAPVLHIETKDFYYDIYVAEDQVIGMKPGDSVVGYGVAVNQKVPGKIRFISEASEFASMRMSRERGQGDLSSFQVRVYTEEMSQLLPGMTIEVNINEFLAR